MHREDKKGKETKYWECYRTANRRDNILNWKINSYENANEKDKGTKGRVEQRLFKSLKGN